jgi:hypothetical protein
MTVPVFGHYALPGYVFTLFLSIFDSEWGGSTFLGNSSTFQKN